MIRSSRRRDRNVSGNWGIRRWVFGSLLAAGLGASAALSAVPPRSPSQSTAEMGLLSLSPDGQWLLVSARPRMNWSQPIRLANVDCLKRLRRIEGCIEAIDASTVKAWPVWSADSQAFLLVRNKVQGSGPIRFERGETGWRATDIPLRGPALTNNLPPVLNRALLAAWPDMSGFEARATAWQDLAPATAARLHPDSLEAMGEPFFDRAGRVVGWDAFDSEARSLILDRTSVVSEPPLRVRRRRPGSAMPNWDFGSVQPKLDGDGFYVRSGQIGPEPGILEFHHRGVVRSLALPPRPGAPLKVVFTPSVSMAVGVFSIDGFHGVEAPKAFARDLNRYIRSARRRAPSLELMQVIVPDGLNIVALRFRDVAGPDQIHVFDPATGAGFRVLDDAEPDPEPALPFTVHSDAVRLPSPGGGLPARLYSADRSKPARGLVVTFHGGPPANIFSNGHEWTRVLLALGFDVLDVDYRGSTGYGEVHLLALRPPIAKPVGDDLAATLSWIARHQEYADGLIGVQGASFGGYFGVVAIQSAAPRIDFVILDSPLIDPQDQRRAPCGDFSTLQVDLFGEKPLEGNLCTLGSTGAFDLPRYAAIPAFAIAADQDTQTPAATTRRWTEMVNARGGCVTLVGVAGGRHTMPAFPAKTRAELQTALTLWLSEVGAGRAAATCGSRLSLVVARTEN